MREDNHIYFIAVHAPKELVDRGLTMRPPRNGRKEHYLIVACTVITDVPEAAGPCPVALMEKVSLPLYLAFALYSKLVMLSFFSLPCIGFSKMLELLTVPRIAIGNRQLPPDATLMSAVEFWPQSASSANFEQSEAATAADTGIEPEAPTTSAKAATLDNRILDFLVFAFPFFPPGKRQKAWMRAECGDLVFFVD